MKADQKGMLVTRLAKDDEFDAIDREQFASFLDSLDDEAGNILFKLIEESPGMLGIIVDNLDKKITARELNDDEVFDRLLIEEEAFLEAVT